MRTVAGRCRIPDVCVVLIDPGTDILESPPFIAVEILSQSDEMTNVVEKLEEYWAIGVPYIWLLDPRRSKAYTFQADGLGEVRGQELVATEPEIRLSLADVFHGL